MKKLALVFPTDCCNRIEACVAALEKASPVMFSWQINEPDEEQGRQIAKMLGRPDSMPVQGACKMLELLFDSDEDYAVFFIDEGLMEIYHRYSDPNNEVQRILTADYDGKENSVLL